MIDKINRLVIACVAVMLIHQSQVLAQDLTIRLNEVSLNLREASLPTTGALPKITWIDPQLEITSSQQNKINVKAIVKCFGPLKEIKLVIGNVADGTALSSRKFETVADKREYEINATLFLPDGDMFFSLECTSGEGITISDRRQVLVGNDAMENMVNINRKDYALIFATDKYDNWDDLVNPIFDATAIAKELTDKYGFEVDLVQNPTVEQIWEKLREYNGRRFAPQDQLMVFFAGHGHFDDSFGEGYVVAKNSLKNDLSRTSYLSHNRLRGVIDNISCNHILLAMDVCFGGTFDPTIARSRGARDDEASPAQMLIRKWSYRTRKYLTSGGKEYVSDGVADKHSPFAGQMIESLRSQGGDDRILTLTELQANLERLKQLPRFGSFGTDEPLSDFVFIRKSSASLRLPDK